MNHNWEFDYSNLYNRNSNTPPSQQPIQDTESQHTMPQQNNYSYSTFDAPPQPHQEKKGTRKTLTKQIGIFAVMLVLCAGAGFGGGYFGGIAAKGIPTPVHYQPPVTSANAKDPSRNTAPQGALNISQIASKVSPSVVEISTEVKSTTSFFPQFIKDGAGSGVIISQDGYIITNNHVIAGASQISVRTSDKKEYPAKLIGTDPKTDVAVIKVDTNDFIPAIIGNSDELLVGEFSLAVGNPLGTLGGTVTSGIISALDRDINVKGQTMNLLQTDAAVSPGNSGGGLFNEKGELIGIVNAKWTGEGAEGLGFAIPINKAMEITQNLIQNGYVAGRPALGIKVFVAGDVQSMLQYGLTQPGVYIVEITPNSAAAKAGLQVSDRIISVDGNAVASTQDVTSALDTKKVGDEVRIQVARDGKVMEIPVSLEEQPRPSEQPVENPA